MLFTPTWKKLLTAKNQNSIFCLRGKTIEVVFTKLKELKSVVFYKKAKLLFIENDIMLPTSLKQISNNV